MFILDLLYSLIIKPLILIFDVIFSFTLNHILYVGWSIVVLSLVINLLVLPLYIKADAIQVKETLKKKKLSKWENHIKKHFKGDQRLMMLQTYYRQNDFKPYQSLKSAIPLFLEIPFFIAAYVYISKLPMLNGYSFGPIRDLAKADNLLFFFGVNINVMPIIMTVINIVSSFVYNRSSSMKDKFQLFIIAFLFLVLLYNSPSGLVLYWTCNNIFSLIKNIIYLIIEKLKSTKVKVVEDDNDKTVDYRGTFLVFLSSSLLLAFLIGAYIPTVMIKSSVDEFINLQTLINPAWYIINSLFMGIGLLFVWIGVYYYLLNNKGKYVISEILFILCVVAFLNYSSIPYDSSMSMYMTITAPTEATLSLIIKGIIILVSSGVLCHFAIKYKRKIVSYILLFAMLSFAIINVFYVAGVYVNGKKTIDMISKYDEMPEIHLSKNKKNVVVIMMDKMVGYYIPYILKEKPELVDSFDGFTFYPNTISFATATNGGSPGLYGGYEYRPSELNKRDTELLRDKQNEALKVMPVMFLREGYDVTVGNPTYANYKWIPDLSIYNDYPDIYKYNSLNKLNPDGEYYPLDDILNRNLLCYGVYRTVPIFLEKIIYNGGLYGSTTVSYVNGIGVCNFTSLSTGYGIGEKFFNAYNHLANLSSITKISDNDNGSFNMFGNDTTHEANILKEPDYTLSSIVDNTAYDSENPIRTNSDGQSLNLYGGSKDLISDSDENDNLDKVICYQTNMVSMLKIAEWLDYLKENGVYDNTRIIIVSDHSAPLGLDSNLMTMLKFSDGSEVYFDILAAQSTLLVKDFESTGFKTNSEFMTNADVPTIATQGLIDNPTNPFTGKLVNNNAKLNEEMQIMYVDDWHTSSNSSYKFSQTQWFSVHDNIFDINNWDYIGAY